MAEKVEFTISADDQASKTLEGIDGKFKGMQDSAKTAGLAFGAIAAAGTFMIKEWIDAAEEAQKVQTQLGAVIKSTGGAAGYTVESMNALTKSFEGHTTASKEAIGATENMLLTFTEIKNGAFKDATQAVLDMSTAMNGGLTPAADKLRETSIQVGKALNDPIKGMTALHRVGVAFTDAQKEQITTLQKSGDMLGAQNIILKELSTEFGGSALAATTTFSGAMEIMGNRFHEIQEQLGNALLPVLKQVGEVIGKVVEWFENLNPQLQDAFAKTALLVTVFAAVGAVVAGVIAVTSEVVLIIGGVVFAVGALYLAWETNFLGIRDIATGVFNWIIDKIKAFWDFFSPTIMGIVNEISADFQLLVGWIRDNWDTISAILNAAWDAIKIVWGVFWEGFKLTFKVAWEAIVLIFSTIWNTIKLVFTVAWDILAGVVKVAMDIFSGNWGKAWKDIQGIFSGIWDAIKNYALSIINDIIGFVKGLVGGIQDAINALQKLLGLSASGKAVTATIAAKGMAPDKSVYAPKASGGPVDSSESYLVGEKGPEIFTPSNSGNILPNNKIGGGTTIVINMNGPISSREVAQEYADLMFRDFKMHAQAF